MAGAGYSGTPLIRKLGLRAGMTVRLLDPPADYDDLLGRPLTGLGVRVLGATDAGPADFTHLFATGVAALRAALAEARDGMSDDGMVWVSWPKRASGVPSEVGRAEAMREGKAAGLVDVKVCAVDETWSGLKFVVPVRDRTGGT